MSPYLMCFKDCVNCPFAKDCYDKTLLDFDEYVLSELALQETGILSV